MSFKYFFISFYWLGDDKFIITSQLTSITSRSFQRYTMSDIVIGGQRVVEVLTRKRGLAPTRERKMFTKATPTALLLDPISTSWEVFLNEKLQAERMKASFLCLKTGQTAPTI